MCMFKFSRRISRHENNRNIKLIEKKSERIIKHRKIPIFSLLPKKNKIIAPEQLNTKKKQQFETKKHVNGKFYA